MRLWLARELTMGHGERITVESGEVKAGGLEAMATEESDKQKNEDGGCGESEMQVWKDNGVLPKRRVNKGCTVS